MDPYRYLTYVLKEAPKLSRQETDWAQKLLPESVSDPCKSKEEQNEKDEH